MAVNNLRPLGYRQHTCSDNPCRAIKKKALSLSLILQTFIQAFAVTKEIQADAHLLAIWVIPENHLIFWGLSGTNRKSVSCITELRSEKMRETETRRGIKERMWLGELQRQTGRREKRPRLELFRCHSVMRSARIRHLRRIGAHVGVAHAGEAIHKSSVKPL